MDYKTLEDKIRTNDNFTHNGTMTGQRYDLPDGTVYNIKSYKTLIYSENLETGDKWLNDEKYSTTTSRQQNMIRRVKGL